MMREENMEMGIPYDLTTPWHGGGMGGFQKLLTSPIFYDPEQAELLLPGYEDTNNNSNNNNNNNNFGKFGALSYAQVQGVEQESCVTGVGFHSRSNSDAAEDVGVSDTTTQEDQHEHRMMNAENMALAIPNSFTEKGDGDAGKRRKRKRLKAVKNSEEVESQRMTHIEVERNRRKQMNEHLNVLRSLIPDSYVQRGDQASIIGGAIDLVKELEQVLQSLQLQKIKKDSEERRNTIPQNCLLTPPKPCSARSSNSNSKYVLDTCIKELREPENNISTIADIEVTLIESHASIKILSRKRPGQLVNVITALESLHMTTLHLNITTIDQTVMFSFNIKVEDECKLTSANEIATALHQILRLVHSNDMHIPRESMP